MENQNNPGQFLPVRNESGKHKILIGHVASIERIDGVTKVTHKNGDEFECRWSIRKIKKTFPDCGLLILKRNTMVNLNHVADDEKLDFSNVVLKGGKSHCICCRMARELKRLAKKYKLKFWKDYRKMVKG